ncbi:hypothetical protein GHT89_16370 [Acinetobacter baumannii]|uniref:hypothetical protein n=1 Tax=Acinetobacter baumannii TaxID=470 RepID=UPI00387DC2D6
MRNIVLLSPYLLILAAGMAFQYKDDPEAPFNALITLGWWAFGVTTVITLIVALASNKERPGYHARIVQIAGMPIFTLLGIGFTYFIKSSLT